MGADTPMTLRIIGAILILAGCGGYGFYLAFRHKREVAGLLELESILNRMICELEYKLTPLPQLCRLSATHSKILGKVFTAFADRLEMCTVSDVGACMEDTLQRHSTIPPVTALLMKDLGYHLGEFALNGQISQLHSMVQMCQRHCKGLESGQEARLRSYRTLGICAGAALVILFL